MKIHALNVNLRLFLRRYGLFVTLALCAVFWWVVAGSFR